MNKTKIEWCDYTWNPVKGLCPQGCFYCYARRIYERFGWDKKVRLDEDVLWCDKFPLKPSRIFVGSTIELFHKDIPDEWIQKIINRINNDYHAQKHIFIFLSKNPERYASFDFPNNCWLGATVTRKKDLWRIDTMRNIGGFISIEPLIEDVSDLSFKGIKWIIIGAMTGRYRKQHQPQPEWIREIRWQAGLYNIPIFMKENLSYMYKQYYECWKLTQKFPK